MNSNNRFMDGFLLGAIVGGAAVFLLGTKKGNKVLKAVTEDGFEGLTDLLENIEELQSGASPKPKTKPAARTQEEEVDEEEVIELEKPVTNGATNGHSHPAKRFFKRK